MHHGKLYLLPSPLSDGPLENVLPQALLERISSLKVFVVEETRTARRFLSKAGHRGHIDELEFHELNEHTSAGEIEGYVKLFEAGDVGLISEAGLPAVADPGAALVALCHSHGIEVVPYVGPSSLMLALMASGLNGQSFAFVGYLTANTAERRVELKNLEKTSLSLHQTQIFIETPYRNDSLLADILAVCGPNVRLCVAADITGESQSIRTMRVAEWKKLASGQGGEGQGGSGLIGKRPAVFCLLA